jgi:hypothetical protein
MLFLVAMDFEYAMANKQVTITKYTGSSKDVTILTEIGDFPVTTIGYRAFSCNELISISLPQNLTTIGQGAFSYNKLTSIDLPQNLTTIGQTAFCKNKLTSIDLPQNLTTIERYAFYNNELTSINLPQNLTLIDDYAFYRNELASICLPNTFRTNKQIINIFEFSLEELDDRNKKFIKPYLAGILEDYCVHYYFHDIIIGYTLPSNELIHEVMETLKN